ncbi:hypothetical protein FBEOM_5302 [Fusarium beomiforme]|uniref:Uncharacterized protein n=1 Tax=Fusarium beomiforme TaxID=44412 RepID=A0A9P5DZ42_9HYPO|nr:hypothetical protein FBEOM_5302 [Fusarium beomiforme]
MIQNFAIFSAFKTSRSPEVNALIKKHGASDALFIKNLGYFTNISLAAVGESGNTAIHTDVRKIIHDLKDPIGLTPSELSILCFWASHLGSVKILFLGEHACTIFVTKGGKGPYSEYDLGFISFVADNIKKEVAKTEKTMAEACTEYGDVLNIAYALGTKAGKRRLLSGSDKP